MSVHDLRDALAESGCPICRLKTESGDHFVASMLWDGVTDPTTRGELRQSQGFCREHMWRLVRHGSSLGVAIITRDLLERALKGLAGASYQTGPTLSLRRVQEALDRERPASATAAVVQRLEPEAECPACLWAAKMEQIYLGDLLKHLLGETGLLEAYRSSEGLCLPHLRQALMLVRDSEVFDALVEAQRAIWEGLIGELSEFIRKSDHRFRHEEWGEERDAWIRAIGAIAGARLE
jgi:hypothetical protein